MLLFLLGTGACNLSQQDPEKEPLLYVPEGLEATLWAESPLFYNPTNIDVDIKGRIWVTEAVNYRNFNNDTATHFFHPKGDRVMILEDTDGDGSADTSKLFVQDKDLVSPLGIAVIGNQVIVSCSPSVIIYTDEDGDDKPDKKEVFLTGFGGRDHDHGLHSGVAGPDGKWYFNAGNAGPHVVSDRSGWTLRTGSVYTGGTPYNKENTPAMKSDDGNIYTGGLVFRIDPDGTGMEVLAHNFRNSYEVCVDSYGNMWQNDNDDQVASCRTSWVMEGGNAGYFSSTGIRTWQADRRPGQSIQTAHWHQEDPGVTPAGDIYGAGSPTGMAVYEGDALGEKYRGLVLNADAGRNIVFGYLPATQGAGYSLDKRLNFIASVDTDNEDYRWNDVEDDRSKWFRPSDVVVGTDGAIYVADWYDPIVGGHQMYDEKGYGRIYRIAPADRELAAPSIDPGTIQGQVQALLSPAVNVRYQGFQRLKAQGSKALPAVLEILSDENPYHRARAVWLLSQMGEQGVAEAEKLLEAEDPQIRVTALRALRQVRGDKVVEYARRLARDPSAAVRREVAIALKDVPLEQSREVLLTLADGFDGKDPWYLNAMGIALRGKEAAFYPDLLEHFRAGEPADWPQALAALVWELHPPAAAAALRTRAGAETLSPEARKRALTALAFIPTREAATAARQLEKNGPEDMRDLVQWWLQFRQTNTWETYLADWEAPAGQLPEARPELKDLAAAAGDTALTPERRLQAARKLAADHTGKLYLAGLMARKDLPQPIIDSLREPLLDERDQFLKALLVRYVAPEDTSALRVESVASLTADPGNGRLLFNQHCLSCHKIGQVGNEIGPDLSAIQTKYGKVGLLEAIVHPDAGVAFGSEPYLLFLKNGAAIYGLLQSNGPVVTAVDVRGSRYMMKASEIESRQKLNGTIMPPPRMLQLGEKEVADIAAFLLQEHKTLAGR